MLAEVLKLSAVGAVTFICLWLGGAEHWAVIAVVVLFVIALLAILVAELRHRS